MRGWLVSIDGCTFLSGRGPGSWEVEREAGLIVHTLPSDRDSKSSCTVIWKDTALDLEVNICEDMFIRFVGHRMPAVGVRCWVASTILDRSNKSLIAHVLGQ